MVHHFIILSSSYSTKERIAIDFSSEDKVRVDDINHATQRIKNYFGDDFVFATHKIVTDSISWQSVVETDAFFADVKLCQNVSEFISKIAADRKLSAIDISKFILSYIACTPLKLQKLLYLCYADYLCSTDEELFIDDIVAYKYGPVVESVYQEYKPFKNNVIHIDKIEDDIILSETDIIFDDVKINSAYARITFSKDGLNKIKSIIGTLDKFKHYSAEALVGITHAELSPWSQVYEEWMNNIITDDIIKTNHCYE